MKRVFLCLLPLVLISCAKPPREVPTSYRKTEPIEISKVVPGWLRPYSINGKTYYPLPKAEGYEEECLASWYGPGFHGRQAASGEIYDMYQYTAAHKILPIGTYVLVRNLENGKELIVRINDRGPFVEERCIDLSYASAKELGLMGKGLAKVRIVALSEGEIINNQIVYTNVPNIRFNEFYLQVGAFKNYSNALRYKLELEKEYKKVTIEPYEHPTLGLIYRVQIYLSEDLNSAYLMANTLKKERFREAFLVAK
ncbi:MAG: septal ring lytic transglycosylase RlpA family protein [Caldimicrobium sp.]